MLSVLVNLGVYKEQEVMTNGTMFAYAYGILMKQGTSHAWEKINDLSKSDEHFKKWMESPYVQTANQDALLLKALDSNGL